MISKVSRLNITFQNQLLRFIVKLKEIVDSCGQVVLSSALVLEALLGILFYIIDMRRTLHLRTQTMTPADKTDCKFGKSQILLKCANLTKILS